MLLHPHVLVKLATAQLIGTVFSLLGDPNEVLSSLGWKRPKTVTTSAPEKRAENKSERYACCLEFIKGPVAVVERRPVRTSELFTIKETQTMGLALLETSIADIPLVRLFCDHLEPKFISKMTSSLPGGFESFEMTLL